MKESLRTFMALLYFVISMRSYIMTTIFEYIRTVTGRIEEEIQKGNNEEGLRLMEVLYDTLGDKIREWRKLL
jgi:hypothetical protein